MENLFSEIEENQKSIKLEIYCDEVKENTNKEGVKWMYFGMLIIPTDKKEKAIQKLNETRKAANYFNEFHFSKLTNYSYAKVNNEKTLLAKKWIELIKKDGTDKCFYWNIVGINCSNLNFDFFGNDKKEHFQNVYNLFFRSLLKGALNNFFADYKIHIHDIFHDKESQLQTHRYFNWHAIYILDKTMKNVWFNVDNITFVDSDHNKEDKHKTEANFIQLIDLLVGSFRQAFDNSSKKAGKQEIGNDLSELLSPMMKMYSPKNNRFYFYRKYAFSFFPMKRIKTSDLINSYERASSTFYNARKLCSCLQGQGNLFE